MIRVIVTRVLFFLSLSKIDVNHSSLPNKAESYNIRIYIYKYTDIYIYVYISLVISSFSPATDCLTPSLNNVQHKQRSLDRHPPSSTLFTTASTVSPPPPAPRFSSSQGRAVSEEADCCIHGGRTRDRWCNRSLATSRRPCGCSPRWCRLWAGRGKWPVAPRTRQDSPLTWTWSWQSSRRTRRTPCWPFSGGSGSEPASARSARGTWLATRPGSLLHRRGAPGLCHRSPTWSAPIVSPSRSRW